MMQTPLLEEASDNPQGYPLVLARGVSAFLLEYWDVRQAEWATDPPPTNQLPPLVRTTLGISSAIDASAPPEVVTRIVRIASASVTPSMQAPLLPPGVAPIPPGGPQGGGNPILQQQPPPGPITPRSGPPAKSTGTDPPTERFLYRWPGPAPWKDAA